MVGWGRLLPISYPFLLISLAFSSTSAQKFGEGNGTPIVFKEVVLPLGLG